MSISNKISALLKYYSLTEGQNKIQQGKPNFHCFLCNLNTMRSKIQVPEVTRFACAAAMMYEIVRHVFQQYHVCKFEFSFHVKGLAFFPEVHVVPFISQPYIVNF